MPRKVFEFDNGEKFWVVAETEPDAIKCIEDDYEELAVFNGKINIREVNESEYILISDEYGREIVLWDAVTTDALSGMRIPYMISATIWEEV